MSMFRVYCGPWLPRDKDRDRGRFLSSSIGWKFWKGYFKVDVYWYM